MVEQLIDAVSFSNCRFDEEFGNVFFAARIQDFQTALGSVVASLNEATVHAVVLFSSQPARRI